MYDWNDDRVIVRNQKPEIVLTFDDGPTKYLGGILSILHKANVQGVFFWQTNHLRNDTRWKEVLDEGHFIGTHSRSHPKLPDLPYCEQYQQIQSSTEKLELTTGKKVNLFRPPYGLYNEDTITAAKKLGLDVVLWQVASWDWKHEEDEEMILKNVLEHVSPGDIVLLHELPQTVKILPELISALRKKGFVLSARHSELVLQNELS